MEDQVPASMDKHLDVLQINGNGGLLLGASSLTGRYWLGSLWYYTNPERAPEVDKCTAGVQLEAGVRDASWVDTQRVLVGLDTGGAALWELQDENKLFGMISSANEHDNMVSSVSVNSDASQFVTASYDHTIKVWNPDLTSLYTYKAHSDIVWDVQCHPTEPALFLSCSQDGKTVLWDSRESKPATLIGKCTPGFSPTCVRWQPSARNMYAVGDEGGNICLQDLRAVVEKTVTYQPHNRFVTRLAFSPERPNLLASVSEDCGTVVATTNASSADVLYKSTGHTDFVCGLAWQTGDRLLTSSWDGRIIQHVIGTSGVNGGPEVKVNGDIEVDEQPGSNPS
ncbi:hypothetical protein V1264_015495 [Littorina saxatilis]